jgi:rhodanese-related sulfurtransferase
MALHRKITAVELRNMLDRQVDIVLINTLPEEKFAEGHIPGSENIPSDSPNFVDDVLRVASNKGRRIVVYCGGGKESALAASALEEAGFTNVDHFQGGIAEWNRMSFPVETGIHSESRR